MIFRETVLLLYAPLWYVSDVFGLLTMQFFARSLASAKLPSALNATYAS